MKKKPTIQDFRTGEVGLDQALFEYKQLADALEKYIDEITDPEPDSAGKDNSCVGHDAIIGRGWQQVEPEIVSATAGEVFDHNSQRLEVSYAFGGHGSVEHAKQIMNRETFIGVMTEFAKAYHKQANNQPESEKITPPEFPEDRVENGEARKLPDYNETMEDNLEHSMGWKLEELKKLGDHANPSERIQRDLLNHYLLVEDDKEYFENRDLKTEPCQ